MKINYTLLSLICAATLSSGCSNLYEEEEIIAGNAQFDSQSARAGFAPDDGAQELSGSPAKMVSSLLNVVGPEVTKGFGEIPITSAQYEEIKEFTDNLVKDCKTEEAKYKKIFSWIYKTLEYKHEYEGGDVISNDPYPVFKTHVAICQGFANLQHIMLESQNIPTLNVNGDYVGVGGHAWNYVYHSQKWWVSDPTNNGSFSMGSTISYQHLSPRSIDANIFETEDCTFTFQDYEINIDSIKSKSSQFIVPFSVGGFKVTSLNPSKAVPTNIKEIYISRNIKTLGEYYRGLDKNAPSIEMAFVDPLNRSLESYTGAVYRKNGSEYQLYYIPSSLKSMELKPMRIVDKNVVFDHKGIEEVIIPTGTKEIQNYAFEKCPNLRVAYVPSETKIAEKAFWNVHPDFKVIRADYTGIPEIKL